MEKPQVSQRPPSGAHSARHATSIELERLSEGATVLPDAKSPGDASLSNKGDGSPADPFCLLPEHEAHVLKRQVETPDGKYGMFSVYRYATTLDTLIIIVSIIMSLAAGAALPAMTIIFGGLQGIFAEFLASHTLTLDEFKKEMSRYVLYFVYLAIGTFVANYVSTVGFLYTGEHITAKLRMRYLESCLRQNIGFFDNMGAGEVAVKITSDANTVQEGISEKVGLFFNSLATLITGFLIGFIISWKLTLILSATFVAQFINTAIGASFIIKYGMSMGVAFAQASSLAQEVLSSIRVATAFGSQDRLATKYDGYLAISQKWGTRMKMAVGMMMAVVMSLLYLNYGLGFWQGATFLARGDISMDDMLTTLMSVMLGSFNVGAIGPYFQSFSEATGTAARLLKVIDRKTPIDATSDEGEKLPVVEGRIRLENIRHIYPSRPEVTVMDGVSLDIPAGKVTALVGASGSGKSTIIGLVERFYSPIGGAIYLDGTDINTLNIRWLRQQIGLVGQEPILFAVSIFENIRYGLIGTDYENASEASQREMIVEAAKKANAHEFISQLSDGYETNVGQRGFLLSGGQKQRVAIARAIVSNPKSESITSANFSWFTSF
jgi:ATP-binding cassette subfamily B (MDR/TAP) protein 1